MHPEHEADPAQTSFRDVDAGGTDALVAMMDDTDRWPSVRAARSWVLDRAGDHQADGRRAGAANEQRTVLDVGCGPGTFNAGARSRGWTTTDLDRSTAMVDAARARSLSSAPGSAAITATCGVLGDASVLPFADASFELVHCERVLQWADDPSAALAELWRVTAPGGHLALTDTDWGTFVVDGPSGAAADAVSAAALGWVSHPRLARTLSRRLTELGAAHVDVRADAVVIDRWDPDDPAQVEGPPGLPLTSIAAGAAERDRVTADAAVAAIARMARGGSFFATLTIITAVAHR